ncbi:hypothetical protein [Martelella radicis]|nr:hypothetical protein [Martelella radicis]
MSTSHRPGISFNYHHLQSPERLSLSDAALPFRPNLFVWRSID